MLVQSDHLFGLSGVEGFFSREGVGRAVQDGIQGKSIIWRAEGGGGGGGLLSGKYRFDLGPHIKCFSRLKNTHSPYPQ